MQLKLLALASAYMVCQEEGKKGTFLKQTKIDIIHNSEARG